jgi:hypothetical protein
VAKATQSAITGMPGRRSFPDPPGLGISISRTGRGLRDTPLLRSGSVSVRWQNCAHELALQREQLAAP